MNPETRSAFVHDLATALGSDGLLPWLARSWAVDADRLVHRLRRHGLDNQLAIDWALDAVLAPKRRGVDADLVQFLFDRVLDDLLQGIRPRRPRRRHRLLRLPVAGVARNDRDHAIAECEAKRRIIGTYVYFAERAADDPAAIGMATGRDMALRSVLDIAWIYADHLGFQPQWQP